MRSCALMPYLHLLEIVNDWEVPPAVAGSARLAELNDALSDAVLWTNDLYSCEKEQRLGDVHNLVIVLAHADRTDLQTAAMRVAQLTQNRIDTFTALVDGFPDRFGPGRLCPESTAKLTRHVENMTSWLSGQMDWRRETRRNAQHNLRVVHGVAQRVY